MFSDALCTRAEHLLAACRAKRLLVATAESCTGGLIGGLLTEIAGSSDVFDRGFITYSNDAKITVLGVDAALIKTHGAVSEPVARAMAEGAIVASQADISVAVTGVAGPGGGTADKPVGLVHFATATRGDTIRSDAQRFGDIGRTAVRIKTVEYALSLLERAIAD